MCVNYSHEHFAEILRANQPLYFSSNNPPLQLLYALFLCDPVNRLGLESIRTHNLKRESGYKQMIKRGQRAISGGMTAQNGHCRKTKYKVAAPSTQHSHVYIRREKNTRPLSGATRIEQRLLLAVNIVHSFAGSRCSLNLNMTSLHLVTFVFFTFVYIMSCFVGLS